MGKKLWRLIEHSNFSVNNFFRKNLGPGGTSQQIDGDLNFLSVQWYGLYHLLPFYSSFFKVLPTKTFNKMKICGVFRPVLQKSLISSILRFHILVLNFHPFTTSWQTRNLSCFFFVVWNISNLDVQNIAWMHDF